MMPLSCILKMVTTANFSYVYFMTIKKLQRVTVSSGRDLCFAVVYKLCSSDQVWDSQT